MKKIIILLISFSFLGVFIISCENSVIPEKHPDLNNYLLSKKDFKKNYTYHLLPCYSELPDANGIIKLKLIYGNKYSFDLKADKLEPDTKYYLKARVAGPVEIVCPYTLTNELVGVADNKGSLKMSGALDLKNGYTIYLFTINNNDKICFHKILEIEKILF